MKQILGRLLCVAILGFPLTTYSQKAFNRLYISPTLRSEVVDKGEGEHLVKIYSSLSEDAYRINSIAWECQGSSKKYNRKRYTGDELRKGFSYDAILPWGKYTCKVRVENNRKISNSTKLKFELFPKKKMSRDGAIDFHVRMEVEPKDYGHEVHIYTDLERYSENIESISWIRKGNHKLLKGYKKKFGYFYNASFYDTGRYFIKAIVRLKNGKSVEKKIPVNIGAYSNISLVEVKGVKAQGKSPFSGEYKIADAKFLDSKQYRYHWEVEKATGKENETIAKSNKSSILFKEKSSGIYSVMLDVTNVKGQLVGSNYFSVHVYSPEKYSNKKEIFTAEGLSLGHWVSSDFNNEINCPRPSDKTPSSFKSPGLKCCRSRVPSGPVPEEYKRGKKLCNYMGYSYFSFNKKKRGGFHIANYVNSLKSGLSVSFYEDGTTKYIQNYKLGLLSGPYALFDPGWLSDSNSQAQEEVSHATIGQYKDGKAFGIWKILSKSQKPILYFRVEDGMMKELTSLEIEKRNLETYQTQLAPPSTIKTKFVGVADSDPEMYDYHPRIASRIIYRKPSATSPVVAIYSTDIRFSSFSSKECKKGFEYGDYDHGSASIACYGFRNGFCKVKLSYGCGLYGWTKVKSLTSYKLLIQNSSFSIRGYDWKEPEKGGGEMKTYDTLGGNRINIVKKFKFKLGDYDSRLKYLKFKTKDSQEWVQLAITNSSCSDKDQVSSCTKHTFWVPLYSKGGDRNLIFGDRG